MKPINPHISDEELLLLADDEIRPNRSMAMRDHLATCSACEQRLAQIQQVLAQTSAAYHASQPMPWEASGPRALLKARLGAEREHLRMPATHGIPAVLTMRNLVYACALILAAALGVRVLNQQRSAEKVIAAGQLPNPVFTPGSTRQASLTELCALDREEVVKNVPSQVEQRVFQEYGIKRPAASNFEVDYLITPGLGGSDDLRNLWPEPHSNAMWNSFVKDQLEDHLHHMVCERKISLEQAQRDMSTNWIAAYKKYFATDRPLATLLPSQPIEVAALR